MSPSPAISRGECSKCTASKAGKQSCCSPGGAWFKKCGDAGDVRFDHTWTEGIQACKDMVVPSAVNSRAMSLVEAIAYPLKTVQSSESTHHRMINISHPGVMPDGGTSGFETSVGFTRIVVFNCVSCIILYLQT